MHQLNERRLVVSGALGSAKDRAWAKRQGSAYQRPAVQLIWGALRERDEGLKTGPRMPDTCRYGMFYA